MSYYLMTNPGYMLGTILVVIAMVFSLYCQAKIKSTYAKYRQNKIAVVSQGHKWLEKY